MSLGPRSAADLTLTRDQETALREATETGFWFAAQSAADRRVAAYLANRGLFACIRRSGTPPGRYYKITPAGRDWLDTHPEAPNA